MTPIDKTRYLLGDIADEWRACVCNERKQIIREQNKEEIISYRPMSKFWAFIDFSTMRHPMTSLSSQATRSPNELHSYHLQLGSMHPTWRLSCEHQDPWGMLCQRNRRLWTFHERDPTIVLRFCQPHRHSMWQSRGRKKTLIKGSFSKWILQKLPWIQRHRTNWMCTMDLRCEAPFPQHHSWWQNWGSKCSIPVQPFR